VRFLPGIAGGDKYIVHNILFKLAIDSGNLFLSDHYAAKLGGHELNGVSHFSNTGVDISLPLMTLVDYRGFRVIALSILPIRKNTTIVMGSNNAGMYVHNSSPELHKRTQHAAEILNLKQHVAGVKQENVQGLFTPTDLEGHIGEDGRLYILDLSRIFPPEVEFVLSCLFFF